MSLYGALYSGVSGLKAQSNKIGVISDNISNVNTIGYKGGQGDFETLVTNANSNTTYSPGGVLGGSRQLISKQGLLQSTDSPTDIAISGGGFFIVNQTVDGTGQILYTRAGSFRQDSTGNFQNAGGFFLQAWPLDREGRLPGEPGNLNTTSSANLSSLKTVNVQNLTGVAAATTNISLGANLQSSQTVYPGAAGVTTMDALHTANFGVKAKDILVPGGVNSLTRGDKFVVSTGAGLSYTYRYGGFTFGRDVSNAANGDSGQALLTSPVTLGSLPFATTSGSNTVTVTQTAHGLATGAVVTLAGNTAAINGIPASEFNGSYVVTVVNANSFTFTTSTSAAAQTLAANPISTTNGSTTVTITQAAHGLATGASVTLAGVAGAINGIPAAELNATHTITVTGANTYTITTTTAATSTATGGGALVTAFANTSGAGTITNTTRPFVGNVLDATSATTPFLGTTGTSGFTAASLSFTITTPSVGTATFTYTSSSPNAQLGQFNTLNNLASAISAVSGLSARVVSNRLYVSATDANESVVFANGSTIGISGPPVQAGLDWVRELGLADLGIGTDRFSTLEGLATLVNASSGLTATIENALSAATLNINVNDPLDTITFADKPVAAALTAFVSATPFTTTNGSTTVTVSHPSPHGFTTGDIVTLSDLNTGPYNGIPDNDLAGNFVITVTSPTTYTITVDTAATSSGAAGDTGLIVTPPNNSGSILAELGLVDSLNGDPYTPQTTGAIGPAYDPNNSAKNMASGAIPAQFSRPIRVFDALGTGHDLSLNFLKTGTNTWAIEIFALPETDVTSALPDGQIASGTVTFNGDGSLRSVSASLSQDVAITWTNGAAASTVSFDWGTAGQPFGTPNASTIGKTDGLSQFNSAYRVNFANQNGAPVGELTSVAINDEGYIIASYSNGETQRLFRIPLADFANPDQLRSISGNVYAQTSDSGEVNLSQAGASGVGKIASASLEASNVELADQLTDMIVAQRAYQANTKVISTADNLLQDLNRILQ